MFDLIVGREQHLPSHATLPIVASTFAQIGFVGLVVILPTLYVTDKLPEVPTMMAFVAAPPTPPPPPPPPPPATPSKPKPMPKADVPADQARFVAPLEEPAEIAPLADDEGIDFGESGGVEGGIPGGIVGGVVGGLPEAPPPPPPPPVSAPRVPVRIGGQITQPALLKRVEPEYPSLAVKAHIQGVVILEATVGEDGNVTDVKLLRSANPLLDREAAIAVRQWRYTPVVLNGTRVPFILTVTLSFSLEVTK
jgi:periplasmic protein TonB